jgi:hypothetical protein
MRFMVAPLGRALAFIAPVRFAGFVACALACSAIGCTDEAPSSSGPYVTSRVAIFEYPISGRARLDILAIIDDSTTMAPYRANVLADLPDLATALADAPRGMLDVNIAVTTANTAAAGAFRSTPSVTGNYIIDGMRDGARVTNYTGDLGAALSSLADVGAASSATNRPLDVLPLALAADSTFLREQAYLLLLIIAASDDASAANIDARVAELKAMKSDPTNVLVAGIYPDVAPRLDDFVTKFPNRNVHTPIDADSLLDDLVGILNIQRSTLAAPCLEWQPFDVDPETAGEQYECVIEDRRYSEGTRLLPRCSGANQPCWDIKPDPMTCFYGPQLTFKVDYGAEGYPYDGTVIHGECLVE